MFFMLSGKFAVKEQPDYREYLKKKFQSIGIPILFFFLVRTIYEAPNTLLSPVALVDSYLSNLLGGLGNTEYWFLFVLIGNLMIAPMFSNSFDRFDHAESKRFLVFGLSFHLCTILTAIFSKPFEYVYIFSGWSFYFYLGALSDKLILMTKEKCALFYGAPLALIGTIILICIGITEHIHDISPLFTIVTFALFFGLKKLGGGAGWPDRVKMAISFVAKHSFSVYLVHMMVLEPLSKTFMGRTGVAHIFLTISTLITSFLLALFTDEVIINPLKRLLQSGNWRNIRA